MCFDLMCIYLFSLETDLSLFDSIRFLLELFDLVASIFSRSKSSWSGSDWDPCVRGNFI